MLRVVAKRCGLGLSPHQVTVTSANELRSDVILTGQKAFLKFETPGTYDYICGLHPNMKGKIEVK